MKEALVITAFAIICAWDGVNLNQEQYEQGIHQCTKQHNVYACEIQYVPVKENKTKWKT